MFQRPFAVYIVTKSAIKKYLFLDMGLGTGAYYLVDWVSSSVIIAIIGSMVVTEVLRKVGRMCGVW